jgi:transcription-repair coupling factor (superfamily II helicase)
LVIAADPADPEAIVGDLIALGVPQSEIFPLAAEEGVPESIRDQDFARRLRIIKSLCSDRNRPRLILATIAAVMQPVPSPRTLRDGTRTVKVGDACDVEGLLQWLAVHGYHGSTAVELPGEFSMRGGILDVFAPDYPQPLRIELFGDDVESLRMFDPATQRSSAILTEVEFAAFTVREHAEGSLLDYLPEEGAVLFLEPPRCERAASVFLQRVSRPERFHSWPELTQGAARYPIAFGMQLPEIGYSQVVDLRTTSVEGFTGELDEVRHRVDAVAGDLPVLLLADTDADAHRMRELMATTEVMRRDQLRILTGALSTGMRLHDPPLLILTGTELFHRSPARRVRAKAQSKAIDSFIQLEAGDLVVHLAHGIALYRGMELIDRHGTKTEHLVLEFDGATKVYVPATKIGLVQKYVGGTKSRPHLARIGGQAWVKHKKAAAAAVTDMAAELLEMQAQRAARIGISFEADSVWMQQFEASFPFTETADQMAAIAAVKHDMEAVQPTDRLICGDVGFGKTEVAMRAAFKAVDCGYQVAVLVPTTVLAEQHFHSFKARMAEYPFAIGKLSRFATQAEQRQVVEQLQSGRLDIVIGTHRLASEDVQFSNLGLVIIDEEQRFGVAIKEKLKAKHPQVEVLTLSATPIPRTLHMSLVGVRDISNLETPPQDRLSIETKVTRWNDQLIRSAILRELNRGGQVFFVHNRVQNIEMISARLRDLVPEASYGIGHGQMSEHQLEQAMVGFVEHQFDVLIATTIIESGLDIPNANTIFVNDADRYGLAELHQLRGRVGRYKHQAYCYMLVDPIKSLTPDAARRLLAIEEFHEMGAGFAIAMRDLEIRGAGNLLGTQQSGHIAAVGYELYCQLLEDAVRKMQRLPPRRTVEVEVDLPLVAYIPDQYVPDLRQKIDLYRRFGRMDDARQLAALREELQDRFGKPPPPVEEMFELAELRIDAALWQISALAVEDQRFLVLRYVDRKRIQQLAKSSRHEVRIVDDKNAYVPMRVSPDVRNGWLVGARSVLRVSR